MTDEARKIVAATEPAQTKVIQDDREAAKRKTMTVTLTPEEMAVLENLMLEKDLGRNAMFRQMLRVYQKYAMGLYEAPPPIAVSALCARLYEVIHHDKGCPAVGGRGDTDCTCDAVPVLRDTERMLGLHRLATTDRLAAELAEARAALADAGRMLDWGARKMKGKCQGSDVDAMMLAAGRTASARAALQPKEGDRND